MQFRPILFGVLQGRRVYYKTQSLANATSVGHYGTRAAIFAAKDTPRKDL